MKCISASIIVLAGAIVLVGGSHVRHDQTQGVLQLLGSAVGAGGLVV
jgi:hypothetical protein